MSGHRRDVRPRYGRLAVLAVSLTVSVVAALAGLGAITGASAPAGAAAKPPSQTTSSGAGTGTSVQAAGAGLSSAVTPSADAPPTSVDSAQNASGADAATATAVPAHSGTGRRIVFSQSEQRVWLMGRSPTDVQRTYLVSGSVVDNLQPGSYSVSAKSRWAVGVSDAGVMQYFVAFTEGPTGAAIGFQTIPTKNGVPLQTKAELGTPQSHGCISQRLPDAIALWNFSGTGTKVVVVA